MSIHLFGGTTAVGQAFLQLAANEDPRQNLYLYSRNVSEDVNAFVKAHLLDLASPAGFAVAGNLLTSDTSAFVISFAPIWLFADFIYKLSFENPHSFSGVCGVVACSSSSAVTKRFAFNQSDRRLVSRIVDAEDLLLAVCRRHSIPCHVLRPTMIYGGVGVGSDRNLSRLLWLMRRLPFLPLPAESGLRQPVNAFQLADVSLFLVHQLRLGFGEAFDQCICLGGDTTLSYLDMVRLLQQAQPADDPARRCRLLPIPNRLFFSLAAPLLLRSPKTFEAVLRMGANLSGFTPAHQLLSREPQPFPVLPLA